MQDYLSGDVTGQIGSSERMISEMKNAVAGPTSVLGIVNTLKQAANASVDERTAKALQAAARRVESGVAQTVKINAHMTLYNANKTGKGRPRPRIRITGLPMQVVTPALGQGTRLAAAGANASLRASEALRAQKLGKLGAATHWTGNMPFLNGKISGGILTFGLSAGLDVYNSIGRDMRGDMRFDGNAFLIASAKSQSGNLVGVAGGAMATGAAAIILGVSAAGAPLILIGLVGGLFAQVVWSGFGGADWAESSAKLNLSQ